MRALRAGEERCAAAVSGLPFAIVRLGSHPPWGLFGYCGRFKVEHLGWIRGYATSWKNEMVVLETDRGPYFLSPQKG
jgi:hypothetical protein